MEQNLNNEQTQNQAAAPYDYRQYDQIWQRVAPSLEPFAPSVPANGLQGPAPVETELRRAEENLPGAEKDPCCMGSEAMDMLEVLTGFIEEALADCRYYQAFACRAPSWARGTLMCIAREKKKHVQTLQAAYYLITGSCYQTSISCDRIYIGPWCQALRERYHAEACSGFNYIRAAGGTSDPCLVKILTGLSKDSYHFADQLMAMLSRSV